MRARLRVPLAACAVATAALAAACGDDEQPATTVASAKTVTATTPQTTTVVLTTPSGATGARTVEGEVEQTATVSPVVTFAGQRASSIGDLDVQTKATLRWSCPQTCERFEVTSDEGDDPRLEVQDSGDSGTATVKRGTYTAVRVRADNAWTLSLEAEDPGD